MECNKYVIITAGGSGERMGTDIPKQFLEVGGKPILRRTIEQFLSLPFDVEIIIAMNSSMRDYWKEYCFRNDFVFRHILTNGGITRFHSVKNCLKYIKPSGVVAVHDGVRPFVTKESVTKLFSIAESDGAAIPVLKVAESMRLVHEDGTNEMVDREKYILVQTPQVFKSEILLESYKQAYSPLFTDDASVVEKAGFRCTLCEGNRLNIKITTPDDLKFAELLIQCS